MPKERAGGKPTPWPMGTVHIQQIHPAFLASVWEYSWGFKALLATC